MATLKLGSPRTSERCCLDIARTMDTAFVILVSQYIIHVPIHCRSEEPAQFFVVVVGLDVGSICSPRQRRERERRFVSCQHVPSGQPESGKEATATSRTLIF